MSSLRKMTRVLAWCFVVSIQSIALGQTAQRVSVSESQRVERSVLDELQASTQDSAFVIVILKLPAEGVAEEPAGAQERKLAAIKTTQDAVLKRFTPGEFEVVYQYKNFPALAGRVSAAGVARLGADPSVYRVGTDAQGQGHLSDSVPFIGADQVQAGGLTGLGVTVAVLDTGIDTNHPDLSDNIASGGWHFLNQGATQGAGAEDDNGHGTNVSGIITSKGVVAPVGVAPDTDILAVKVLDAGSGGWVSDWAAGVDYVVSVKDNYDKLCAINMSLGTFALFSNCPCDNSDSFTMLLQAAIQAAKDAGIATFASSGNAGSCSTMSSPACLSSVSAVAAVYDQALGREPNSGTYQSNFGSSFGACFDDPTGPDLITCFSNRSGCNDLAAPGRLITAPGIGGGTSTFTGTSQASPHVAALAALMCQKCVTNQAALTPDTMTLIMKNTGVSTTDPCATSPNPVRVDALAALTAVCPAGSLGACCLPDSGCQVLEEDDCRLQNGRPAGIGSFCLGDVDGDGIDSICDNCPNQNNADQTDSDSGLYVLDDFESGTLDDWGFTFSTNSSQSGAHGNGAGIWSSTIVTTPDALVGTFSTRIFADSPAHGFAAGPWSATAAVESPINEPESISMLVQFDAIDGTGGMGESYFQIRIVNASDKSKSVSYGFNTTGDAPGDFQTTISAPSGIGWAANVGNDYANKYGEPIPQNCILVLRAFADFAENGSGRRTADIRIDDIQVTGPDGTGDICDTCPALYNPAQGTCDCQPAGGTAPDVFSHAEQAKNRTLSIVPGNAGRQTALRVTLTASATFPGDVGKQWWVGLPEQACENSGQGLGAVDCGPAPGIPKERMWSSPLVCNQECLDWQSLIDFAGNPLDVLHITDADIVTGSTYSIEAIDCACDPQDSGNYSAPLVVNTSGWGDLSGGLPADCPRQGPDGSAGLILDCVGILNKFSNAPCAMLKSRVDLEPHDPDHRINITDVLKCINAFSGLPYPFPGPVGCP